MPVMLSCNELELCEGGMEQVMEKLSIPEHKSFFVLLDGSQQYYVAICVNLESLKFDTRVEDYNMLSESWQEKKRNKLAAHT